MQPSVVARDLGKTYRLYRRPAHRLFELVTRRRFHRPFHALREVAFELPRGESLGIVGENGAGKSTLLKILAGITTPTRGSCTVDGTVAAILELGSGFHPEFTGRQNVVLNAAMLGLGEEEIAEKLPEIIAYSELGDFIDQPVKSYSTGMAMRLAFSIATQVEPAVLIIDEALSVGDGYFQKKCLDSLKGFIATGGTLLFCSHAMYYITSLCERALWLKNGRVEACGPALQVVSSYENFLLAKARDQDVPVADTPRPSPARLTETRVEGGHPTEDGATFSHGEPWRLVAEWECDDDARRFHLGVGINRIDGVEVCSFSTHRDGAPPFSGERRFRVELALDALPLIKGRFTVYVFLLDEDGLHIYDQRILDAAFAVKSASYLFGLIAPRHRWSTAGGELQPAGGAAQRSHTA